MKKIVLWLSRWFIRDYRNTAGEAVRARYGLFGGWISVVINVLLFAVKMLLGFLSGSISLIADAFHTASDAATSVVVVVSFNISRRPSDDKHPYGHGRAEYIGALILAVLLIVIGVEFFRTSLNRMLEPRGLNVTYFLIVAVALTVIVKELLAWFTYTIATLIDSHALRADAWHHRSDALSSIFVVVAIIGARFGVYWLDGAMGIAVATIMALVGVKIFKKAADSLLGDRPSKQLLEGVYRTAKSVDGVLNVHDISVHSYGATKMISLHAQVPESMPPLDAHRIAEQIENGIDAQFESVRTVVHIDPVDISSPLIHDVIREIKLYNNTHPKIASFHDVRIARRGSEKVIQLDLAISKGTPHDTVEHMKSDLSSTLSEKFPGYTTRIDVDPDYFYQKPK